MPSPSATAGLYIHVPFCQRKCEYCDFYSVEGAGGMDRYLAALAAEFGFYAPMAAGTRIATIYLGGGTPSLLTTPQFEQVLAGVHGRFAVLPDAEITVEVNPGTVSPTGLRDLRRLGVNRLSVGVQSFDDAELRFLGRIHTADEARRCVADARSAGFENISIDLIYSLPGQTSARWQGTLAEAIRLRPEHVSAYSLIVEEHTPLFRRVQEGSVVPNGEAVEAALYAETMEILAGAGYEQYEVSNYAVPGRRSRHNASYWSHDNYLGFGPSAHGFWRGPDGATARRWSHVRHTGSWADAVLGGARGIEREERLGRRELVDEAIFLGLRSDGLDLERLRGEFSYELTDRQRRTLEDACVEGLAAREGERVRLTRRGYLVCDELCARMLVP